MDGRLKRRIVGALRARMPDAGLNLVRDPRSRCKWKLPTILRAVLVGICAGCTRLTDVEHLTDNLSPAVRKALHLHRRLPDTTARDLLVALKPDELRESLARQVRQAHRSKALEPDGLPWGVLAIDGRSTAIKAWDEHYAQRQRSSSGGVCGLVRTMTATARHLRDLRNRREACATIA